MSCHWRIGLTGRNQGRLWPLVEKGADWHNSHGQKISKQVTESLACGSLGTARIVRPTNRSSILHGKLIRSMTNARRSKAYPSLVWAGDRPDWTGDVSITLHHTGMELGAGENSQDRARTEWISMKAIWRGKVIAESEETREAGGYTYFPREAVRMELLRKARQDGERPRLPARRSILRRGRGRQAELARGVVLRGAQARHERRRSLDRLLAGRCARVSRRPTAPASVSEKLELGAFSPSAGRANYPTPLIALRNRNPA